MQINCVAEQISQVLLNLLNNAFDAVMDGPPDKRRWVRVDIDLTGENVQLKVTDCGDGISAEVQMKLMQPFFTTKGTGKGTGLGLSISKGIVEKHGGQLFYNRESKNTCFVISLPQYKMVQTA